MVVREELSRLVQNTSVKGVSRLVRADSTSVRLLWLVAIVTCSFFGVYQTYFLLSDFMSFSKVTRIKEHYLDTENLDEAAVPSIHVCNVNPSGLLRHLPDNETYSAFNKMATEKTRCHNCSETDRATWRNIRGKMSTMTAYVKYIGIKKANDLVQNMTDFLIECVVFPFQKSCFEFAEVKSHLSGFYFGCWTIKFPKALISRISMTFYVDSYHSDIHSYVLNSQYSVRSAGVVYKVMERQRKTQIPIGYETKVAAPGMLTTVHIQQEKRRRLPYPYGNCIESDAIENSFENCVDRCVRGNIFNRCKCENVIIQSEPGKEYADQSRMSNNTATESTTRRHNFGYCFDLRQTRVELYERYQWRIQDFSNGGALFCRKWGGAHPVFR